MKLNRNVTIIVTIYDEYWRRSLDNILHQTMKNLEIICIDIGLSVDLRKSVEAFIEKSDQKIILTEKTAEESIVRNRSLLMAEGEYIAFMCGGDCYPSEDTLEQLYMAARESDAHIIGGYQLELKNDIVIADKKDPIYQNCMKLEKATIVHYQELQVESNYTSYLYKKQSLIENKILFPQYSCFGDAVFLVNAIIAVRSYYLVPYATYVSYRNLQRIKWNSQNINDLVKSSIDILKISKEYKLDELYMASLYRLQNKYKDLIIKSFGENNLELYAYVVYATTMIDRGLVKKAKKGKYSHLKIDLLSRLDAAFVDILNEDIVKERWLNLFFKTIEWYNKIQCDSSAPIHEAIVRILAQVFSVKSTYEAKILLRVLLKEGVLKSFVPVKPEYYDYKQLQANIQKLDTVEPAFSYKEESEVLCQESDIICEIQSQMNVPVKLSVIIPMYNVELYLRECIDSVLEQTFKDVEIICVDDGSTDDTLKIALEYAQKHENITVLRQKHGGSPSVARNHGLDFAKGEYIHFLDSDDWMQQDAYDKLYRCAKKKRLDLLFFDAESFFEDEELEADYAWYKWQYMNVNKFEYSTNGTEYYIQCNKKKIYRPSVVMYIVRRHFLIDNDIKFINGLIYEDNIFTNICLALSKRSNYLSEIFYKRRVRHNSIMTVQNITFKNAYSYYLAASELYNFAKKTEHDLRVREILLIRAREMIDNARNMYSKIENAQEKLFYLGLPTETSLMFYTLVVSEYEKVTRYLGQHAELKQKFDRINGQKNSIEDVLQGVKEENNELSGIILRQKAETQKLMEENQRQKQEIQRQKQEIQRQKEENQRQKEENQRQEEENQRQKEENLVTIEKLNHLQEEKSKEIELLIKKVNRTEERIRKIKESKTYCWGRRICWLPSKIRVVYRRLMKQIKSIH